ncbi:MAG: fumarylacetoacetate hydrolase family protein, partial [Alphaproteobacteria bacterium]|nr:fumarylacetoacetate hydrolase family protein [Alphaproteobacteria bacterium]
MKLVTFTSGRDAEIGMVDEEMVTSLSRAAPRLVTGMIDLITRWRAIEGEVRRTAKSGPKVPLKEVRLLPPIPRPGKILAIGLNYADHILETGHEMPSAQVWFCKQPTAAHGPYDPILLPKVSKQVDYEAELVVVVGQGGRYIPKDRAAAAVFGYCAGNDVSARDWQMATS